MSVLCFSFNINFIYFITFFNIYFCLDTNDFPATLKNLTLLVACHFEIKLSSESAVLTNRFGHFFVTLLEENAAIARRCRAGKEKSAKGKSQYRGVIPKDGQSTSQSSVASHLRNVKHFGSNHGSSTRLGIS